MNTAASYQLAIVGGGLAGLALAILSAKAGISTILLEKGSYPMHKVCGEYLSKESEAFLNELGLEELLSSAPRISKLVISEPKNLVIESNLKMGAIGISRYKLDHALSKLAIQHGATILEQTTVKDISTKDNHTLIHIEGNDIMASMVVLSYGKLSILEKKIKKIEKKANEYVGVKYHVRGNFPIDSIALHNFEGGYCGMSAIEDGKYCVCYLADARLLKKYKGDIQSLEREILWQNPLLQKIFTESEFLFKVPVTISNIEFKVKNPVYRDMLFLGDAAGSIAPLSGNGMSMALHAAKLAYREIKKYVDGNQHHDEMLKNYERQWRKNFYWRVKIGSILQQIIGNTNATHWALKVLKPFPWLVNRIVKATHGKQF